MKFSILSAVLTFFSLSLFAQPVTGDWFGSLDVQKARLHLVFHIKKDGNSLTTTMDSPDQGATGIKTDTTYLDQSNNLNIEAKALRMKYVASYDTAKKRLSGIFQQGGMSVLLDMKRTKDETKVKPRPQDPTDYPYIQEEVTFKNTKDTVTLAGTLTIPKDKKAEKIVILISGSGPQDRNEEIKQFNHRPFLVLSDWLTRNGIAVLRYDDRGVGQSTGNFRNSTTADFAKDAQAAVDYIKSRADLKDMQLGLIGHSEGGMIAPMVAVADKRVKFIVLLAGPGTPIDQLLYKQAENSEAAQNIPNAIMDLNLQTARVTYAYMKEHAKETNEQMKAALTGILKAQLAKYPPDAVQNVSIDTLVNNQLSSYMTPWFRYFISYVPADYLTKVKCPVLALNGKLDMQVDATQNLAAIEEALKQGKNKHFEIVPIDGANHLFQKAKTGNPSEYGEITETMNPVVLKIISDWINK